MQDYNGQQQQQQQQQLALKWKRSHYRCCVANVQCCQIRKNVFSIKYSNYQK